MPVRAQHAQLSNSIYFITFTCYKWLPLIGKTNSYDMIFKWFDVLTKKNINVAAYVIMPNHVHLLLHYSGGKSLNTVISNGKRFMAYEIVRFLEQNGEQGLLNKLQNEVKQKDSSRGKKHEVWKDSFDVKECRTEEFILQKLIYIHENPVRDRIVTTAEDYLYSSARDYAGMKGLVNIVKLPMILKQISAAENVNGNFFRKYIRN